MPIFFQHQINETTRLGIWKIEETEEFFKNTVPQHRAVTHPHKRLQHLAGRFLLQFLFPGFPYELIRIADTRKPFLPDEQFHFSISHCGDYAAAIVSKDRRVGVDIEIPVEKIGNIADKFLSNEERKQLPIDPPSPAAQEQLANRFLTPSTDSPLTTHNSPFTSHITHLTSRQSRLLTLLWSAKEAVFKWHGDGGVDFSRHIRLKKIHKGEQQIDCLFTKTNQPLILHYREFEHLVLCWVVS